MFMHLGAIGYTKWMTNVLKHENSSSMDDCKIRCHIAGADITKLYVKHKKILDGMLESVKDKKIRTKIECFTVNECLFEGN